MSDYLFKFQKQSPEFDEFDLITNRNKSELSNSNASNNNNGKSFIQHL